MALRCQQRKQGQTLASLWPGESRDPRWQLSLPFPRAAPQSTEQGPHYFPLANDGRFRGLLEGEQGHDRAVCFSTGRLLKVGVGCAGFKSPQIPCKGCKQ